MLAHESRSLSPGCRMWRAEPGVSVAQDLPVPFSQAIGSRFSVSLPAAHLGIQGCSAEPHHLFFLRIHTTQHGPHPATPIPQGWLRHLLGGLDSTLEMLISGDFLHSAVLPCLSSHGCLDPRRLKLILRSTPNKDMGIGTIFFITFSLK